MQWLLHGSGAPATLVERAPVHDDGKPLTGNGNKVQNSQQDIRKRNHRRMIRCIIAAFLAVLVPGIAGCAPDAEFPLRAAHEDDARYPWHTGVVATTFWIGEIFDPEAEDGSQETSTYDSEWLAYNGCDGIRVEGVCEADARSGENGYAPRGTVPKENPFYLDLPYDDVNNAVAFAERAAVIPWAAEPEYAGRETDPSFSYMKNRWVRIQKGDRECYGQIEDAGPGQYQDKEYVFGDTDRRPANKNFNGAGMDVSPALNGCLGFAEVNGENDRVDWQFVDEREVPPGPWTVVVTTRQVN